MHQKRTATVSTALLTLSVALGAQAGTIDPDLQAAIADLDPKDRIDVIVRCTNPLDPASIRDPDRKAKRKKLVRALREKGTACERLIAKGIADAEGEGETGLWLTNAVAATVRAGKVERLARRRGVESVSLNRQVRMMPDPVPSGEPGDPGYTFWNLAETRITDLWAMGHWGQGVVVATMDSGVDPNHVDIAPNWRGGDNSWFDPNGQHATPYDASGHGTGVMGVMVGGNSTGVDIGAAPGARWIAAKIFDDGGVSDYAKIHQAYQWLLDPDGDPTTDDAPDIVNNSWAVPQTNVCYGEFASDIAALKAAEIAVVFSAGNYGPGAGTSVEPANDPGSLSVGALNFYGNLVWNSSRGPSACGGGGFPRLSAPGKDIFTTDSTGGGAFPQATRFATGTSFAAPHVAGAMAVLKGAMPDATVAELEAALEAGALDLGAAGPDNDTGAGYLDAVEAYYLLASGVPTDADGDGVTDDLDQCPGTPAGETVDSLGCALSQLDTDGDGVSDALDLCGGTPAGTAVDANGCPLAPSDTDGDGVTDDLDQCPNTPAGETVDSAGCALSQLDTDGDGVSDALDLCVGTPAGTAVDANGCPLAPSDTDGDGVTDDLDQCPGTPAGETVDSAGCALSQLDTDGDGVNDALDQCPGTPAGTSVGADGCPLPQTDPVLLYLSLTKGRGTLAGLGPDGSNLAYRDEDILSWNGTDFDMVFDGSAAGLPASADVFAFDVSADRILLAFNAPVVVPGVSGTVDDSDVVAYDRGSGVFSLFFDGSDVGLDSNADRLDAVDLLADGTLLISTRGNPSIPGLSGDADEDLLAFAPTSLGEATSGSWSIYFDGSDVGLNDGGNDEDVDAAAVAATGEIYLSTLGSFSVAGLSGQDEDVFVCTPTSIGTSTACGFAPFFDGTALGLGAEDVDAIDLP